MRIYDANTANANQIYTALHNYVPGKADAGKSAIILSNVDAVGGITTIIMFFFYDGPNPPSTGPLADFLKIPSLIDMTSTQTYAELVSSRTAVLHMLNLTCVPQSSRAMGWAHLLSKREPRFE